MDAILYEKHLEGISQKTSNYGLISYTYNDGKKESDYYSPPCVILVTTFSL